jgi:hypothetical protein
MAPMKLSDILEIVGKSMAFIIPLFFIFQVLAAGHDNTSIIFFEIINILLYSSVIIIPLYYFFRAWKSKKPKLMHYFPNTIFFRILITIVIYFLLKYIVFEIIGGFGYVSGEFCC